MLTPKGRKEIKDSSNILQKLEKWRAKVTRKEIPVMDLFSTGSDIPDNYPVLS